MTRSPSPSPPQAPTPRPPSVSPGRSAARTATRSARPLLFALATLGAAGTRARAAQAGPERRRGGTARPSRAAPRCARPESPRSPRAPRHVAPASPGAYLRGLRAKQVGRAGRGHRARRNAALPTRPSPGPPCARRLRTRGWGPGSGARSPPQKEGPQPARRARDGTPDGRCAGRVGVPGSGPIWSRV